jgi:hypothetical protein
MGPQAEHRRTRPSRRALIRAGSVGLGALTLDALLAARAADGTGRRRSVISIFLSGGLAQHETFDPKPDAPVEVRGEFAAIPTRTPGLVIGEHLPFLAARSDRWALCRSLTHRSNDHSAAHHIMLTGRSDLPPGFDPNGPKKSDWPAIAALANRVLPPQGVLPAAVVLPEKLIHRTGRTIPGQFAGLLGPGGDPWFLECSPFNARTYGAYPEYLFHHHDGPATEASLAFRPLSLALADPLGGGRLLDRVALRDGLDRQRAALAAGGEAASFDRFRGMATALLLDPAVGGAFDITRADPRLVERYGANAFGWSLLLAARLVEAGVALVQVNLGNNETWDTHESAWSNLRRFLLPPLDRALATLLDDLGERGLIDDTLVVMAGEFGRSPRISTIPNAREAGRDHWGRVQSVFLAGGGVRGGTVVGRSDRLGGEPDADGQRPEDLAATIYTALGIAPGTVWHDESSRPFPLVDGRPIPGLGI